MSKAVVVTRRIPQPGRGAEHRAYWLLQTVRESGYEPTLVSLIGPGQTRADLDSVRGICEWAHVFPPQGDHWLRAGKAWLRGEPFTLANEWQPAMAEKLGKLLTEADLLVCCDAVHHTMIQQAAGGELGAFYLLDLAEPLSHRLVTRATSAGGITSWALRSEAKLLRTREVDAANTADLTLVSDEIDLQILSRRAKRARLWAVANGVTTTDGAGHDNLTELPNHIAFCGDLSIAAHQRSAVWLARRVMPTIRKHVPTARLVLMGRGLPKVIRRLEELEWVELLDAASGSGVPEAVRMGRCAVGVASQRQARGAAERTLMMMSLGRPVVTTPAVARTLPDETAVGPALSETGPQIAEATRKLLEDRKHASYSGAQCRRLIKQCGTWQQQWRRVAAVLAQVAEGERVRVSSDSPDPKDLSELRSATYLEPV